MLKIQRRHKSCSILAFKDSANVIANVVYKLAVNYKKEHER